MRCFLFLLPNYPNILVYFSLFALFNDEPEVFLHKYSQTAIIHAAHFKRVVNFQKQCRPILDGTIAYACLAPCVLLLLACYCYFRRFCKNGERLLQCLVDLGRRIDSFPSCDVGSMS